MCDILAQMMVINRSWLLICVLIPSLAIGSQAKAVAVLQYVQQSLSVGGQTISVSVPRGYRLDLLNDQLEGARLISFGPRQEMLIGSKTGRIYRLFPPYLSAEVLLRLDDYPHSVVWRDDMLYIARTGGLYRIAYTQRTDTLNAGDVELVAKIPGGLGHRSRSLGVGPDQKLYVSLGISGNCSKEYLSADVAFSDRRGGVMVLDESTDRPQWVPFASGLRNPVGFDWHPTTDVLYASNNGPDHLGYENPPEYFSKLTPGSFHGMPWFQFDGQSLRRDSCIKSAPPRPQEEVSLPVALLPARNAPMGVAFVPMNSPDENIRGDAVVALRGSWGTQPFGTAFGSPATRRHPKLVLVRFEGAEARRVDDFVVGFQLPSGQRWARPVGVAFGNDGTLYFTSDEETHGLFRLRAQP